MFRNYLKIAFRNLARNKVYSFINIAGLSIGLACAMLILLYVKDEVSFDRFHQQVAHIYRIVQKGKDKGVEFDDSNTGYLQGPRFTKNVAGITSFVRVLSNSEDFKQGAEVESRDVLFVDSSFFSIFSFPLIEGDARTCLQEVRSVVLTAEMAKKQFGTTHAVGKTMMVRKDSVFVPYTVTAVTGNCPQNSTLQYKILMPLEVPEDERSDESWFNFSLNTFVVLDDKADAAKLSANMTNFYRQDAEAAYKSLLTKYAGIGFQLGSYYLQPMLDIHTSTRLPAQNGLQHRSSPMYSYILSGIALFVLLIACINFVNLTVARSVKRSKEIGIRKVVGGNRKQLIVQFLGESFLLCAIAFLLAVVLAMLVLPIFNQLANKELAIAYLLDVKLVVSYLVLFLVTSVLAGFYPALVLSGYNPVETLYRRFHLKGGNLLQKSLIVLQFTLASLLIVATLTIYAQFSFLTKTNLGYDDSNVVVVDKSRLSHEQATAFKNALLRYPGIVSASPKNSSHWTTAAKLESDSTIMFTYETVDDAFLPMMKIPVIQGRNFSAEYPSDSSRAVIVNESFVKQAGWKNPLGQTVNFFFHKKKYQVIGVVKDYHYLSLNQKIGPQLFTMTRDNDYGRMYIKIRPDAVTASLQFIRKTFHEWFPVSPYSYIFKNEEMLKDYETEARWKRIILFGAVLTIFISCIGMFGLSVLSAEKRTKEIGVRKVLGASVNSIVLMLSRDFVKLVLLSLLISFSASWFILNKWLENYPYRIALHGGIYAWAGISVLLIALLTVSFQAVKAAVAAPVKSLRTD
ncbi:ABC transporter permease [Filimonas lacunae]|uniref:ABC transporter permease n=1 Tax=Filimonas lacunae TaxID=477680 RepID=UPI0007D71763|nr:ABC transporter permease [Filimonas lacunae]BAV07076.1 ABC transporter, permease protein [Filimonas lacunae]